MKVYVSGAITGLPIDEARAAFASASAQVGALGHIAVNPFDVQPQPGCVCPNATSGEGAGSNHEWGCYLRGDLVALLDCDAILMLPGWESSHGARLELQVASAVGLRVWWKLPNEMPAEANVVPGGPLEFGLRVLGLPA